MLLKAIKCWLLGHKWKLRSAPIIKQVGSKGEHVFIYECKACGKDGFSLK